MLFSQAHFIHSALPSVLTFVLTGTTPEHEGEARGTTYGHSLTALKNGGTKTASQKVPQIATQVICVMNHKRSLMTVVCDLDEAP